MTHPARINPDTFYAPGVVLPQAYWPAIDNAQAASINGNAGGTWSPLGGSPVSIGGLGMWIAGNSTSGGTIVNGAGSGSRLTHNDSDYIKLDPAFGQNTRTLRNGCGDGVDISGATGLFLYAGTTLSSASFVNGQVAGTAPRPGGRLLVPLRVHHGSTLTTALFEFTPATHASLPAQLPLFRIYKVGSDGKATPLQSGTAIGGGFVAPTPANVAAWNATTSFAYTIDAATVIDTTLFCYFAEIVDESGVNAVSENAFTTVALTFGSIPDMRPQ